MRPKVIEVIVKGDRENKVEALVGLLTGMCGNQRREAIRQLDKATLVDVARAVHGALYNVIDESR